jgi:hypothetical protein
VAKCTIKVKFTGGCLDGESLDNFNTRLVYDYLRYNSGFWVREIGDEAQIMKGGKPDRNWISYETNIFKKGNTDTNGYLEYQYEQSKFIDRCSATTKSGSRCMRACHKDLSVCSTHNKQPK